MSNFVFKAVANAEAKIKELSGDNFFRFLPVEKVFSALKVRFTFFCCYFQPIIKNC